MQRHRHDRVEALVARQSLRQQSVQRPLQRPHAFELEKMNQFAQRAFIGAVGVNLVESRQPQPAQRAPAGFIQRSAIQKRRPAGGAEELGAEQFRGLSDSGYKRGFGKLRGGGCRRRGNYRGTASSAGRRLPFAPLRIAPAGHWPIQRGEVATGEQATREDPPPANTF